MYLGLSDEEFWRLSPKKLRMLIEREDEMSRREDLRAGIIASTIANCFRKEGARPFKPEQFMPRAKQKQTPNQMIQIVEAINAAMGGKDLRPVGDSAVTG